MLTHEQALGEAVYWRGMTDRAILALSRATGHDTNVVRLTLGIPENGSARPREGRDVVSGYVHPPTALPARQNGTHDA